MDAHDKEIEEFTKYEDWAEEQIEIGVKQSKMGLDALEAFKELEKLRRTFGSIDGSVNH